MQAKAGLRGKWGILPGLRQGRGYKTKHGADSKLPAHFAEHKEVFAVFAIRFVQAAYIQTTYSGAGNVIQDVLEGDAEIQLIAVLFYIAQVRSRQYIFPV